MMTYRFGEARPVSMVERRMVVGEGKGRVGWHVMKNAIIHLSLQSTDPAVVERNKFAAEKD